MCFLLLPQVISIQMCDVVNEIELEKERCENVTFGNVTSGISPKHIRSLLDCYGELEAIQSKWETA